MPSFKSDENVHQIAEAYSLDAIDIASGNFSISLDWSEGSIELVEEILGTLHKQMSDAKPDEKTIWIFAKAFGSFIGEVYRKHHGAAWGIVQIDEEEFPGVRAENGVE